MGIAIPTMPKVYPPKTGLAKGPNRGHIVEPLPLRMKPSEKKGVLGTKVNLARTVVREMVGFAPYERRCMDLLNQGFDKRHSSSARRGWEHTREARGSAQRWRR